MQINYCKCTNFDFICNFSKLPNKMIRSIILACALTISSLLYSQDAEDYTPPLSQRIFFGGSFGLQFGTITNIELSPVIGVWLLPRLNVAAGPSFQYFKYQNEQTILYGGRSYFQFMVIQDFNNIIPVGLNFGLFIQGEYEGLSLEKSFWEYNGEPGKRIYSGTFLAGAGITEPIGPRASVNFSVLWPMGVQKYEIYDNPEIRISFIF
jgi:hypothetical protein